MTVLSVLLAAAAVVAASPADASSKTSGVGSPAATRTTLRGPMSLSEVRRRWADERVRQQAQTRTAWRPVEGSFVKNGYADWIFRIVGGAPVYVSDWRVYGGRKQTHLMTSDEQASLPDFPRDGTFVVASDKRAYRFIAGVPVYISDWSIFGSKRPAALLIDAWVVNHADDDPYTPLALRPTTSIAEPRQRRGLPGDPDGVTTDLNSPYFLRGAQTGRVYRAVGGAPLYVPSWAPLGGPRPTVTVDQTAIDRAGQPGPWRFLRRYPQYRWFVRSAQTGQVFTIAGGATVYVATPTTLTAGNNGHAWEQWIPATVDQAVIDRAGGAAPYDHLRYVPTDHTLLYATTDWLNDDPFNTPENWYRVKDGAPHPAALTQDYLDTVQFDWAPVDRITIDRAGQPGPWSHLRAPT